VAPAGAGDALDNELAFLVALLAQGTQPQRVALAAGGVVFKPAGVGARRVGPTVLAQAAPSTSTDTRSAVNIEQYWTNCICWVNEGEF
jgi:uncharacterized protein YjlB